MNIIEIKYKSISIIHSHLKDVDNISKLTELNILASFGSSPLFMVIAWLKLLGL